MTLSPWEHPPYMEAVEAEAKEEIAYAKAEIARHEAHIRAHKAEIAHARASRDLDRARARQFSADLSDRDAWTLAAADAIKAEKRRSAAAAEKRKAWEEALSDSHLPNGDALSAARAARTRAYNEASAITRAALDDDEATP